MQRIACFALLLASLWPWRAVAQEWPSSLNPAYHNTFTKPDEASAPVEGLGRRGSLVITSDTRFVLNYMTTLPEGNRSSKSHTELIFTPGLQFFIVDNFALGASGLLGYDGSTQTTTVGGGPLASYHIGIRPHALSLFPQLALLYTVASPKDASSISGLGVDIYAPLVLHLAPHFFAGVGPAFNLDLVKRMDGVSQDRMRTLAVRFQLGGWI